MKRMMSILLVLTMVFSMTACSDMGMLDVGEIIELLTSEPQETVDTLTRATPVSIAVTLPEGMDSTSRLGTLIDDETQTMYITFNGISSRDTHYFYIPTGELTLTARATGESEGMKSFKIALWEKLEGETMYVPDTTIYFYTNDETNQYVIKGLDPTKQYRMNISYDAYGYYIYGKMQLDGVSSSLPVEEVEGAEGEAA